MPLQKLQFKPGIDRESTSYAKEGGWYDSDKVRFRSGNPEKIGGWDKYKPNAVTGVPRALHVWRDLAGTIYTAIGTHSKIYVETGGVFTDITPIRSTGSLGTNPFTTGAVGSKVITVTHTAHGATNGDYVTFAAATATDGIPASELNAEHELTYVNSNTYTIVVATGASSGSTAGGGGSVTFSYQISVGPVDQTYGYGYGAATYSGGTYGTARASSSIGLPPRLWSIDNWGEDLIVNPNDGSIYVWDASSPAVRAVIITNAPTKVSLINVTKDRHLVALGCNTPGTSSSAQDKLMVRWSHQEDYTDWAPVITNTAGTQLLTGGTEIFSTASIEGQNVIWTDNNVHSMQYIGPPYTFGFQQIGVGNGIISRNAWATYDNAIYWMGPNAFYMYSGGVSTVPSTIQRYVFEGLSANNNRKIFAALNGEFREITWFYPTNTMEDTFVSLASTTTDTTITVSTTAGYPQAGTVLVGSEYITYTGKTDTQLTGCTRGTASTTAAAHTISTNVELTSHPEPTEPCRYASFNVQEQSWYIGRLERCTWIDKGALKFPTSADFRGYLFNHDKGTNAESTPLCAFIESSDFDLGEGDEMFFIRRVIPDFTMDGSVDMKFKTRRYSQSSQVSEVVGTVTPTTEKIDARVRGRHASLRIENLAAGDTWIYGATRVDLKSDGRR
jgi:hypothetical protein